MASDERSPAPPAAHVDQPPPEHALEAPGEEHKVAGSPHAQAANAAVLALTRAARSFTLYDPSNKVVRTLIGEYRDRFRRALDGHGPLVLDVHPFELLLGPEVVYIEKDRERSLAFRLFRDGVRRIAFDAGTSWEELLRLLEILSIRYTGVRQQEDDLVTLLRKAGFDHVHVAAIEGFVPEEEDAEPPLDVDLMRATGERYDPAPQWDLPLPPFPEAAPLSYRPVAPELLERLRGEEAPEVLPSEAVRSVLELLQAPARPDLGAVLGFALEVREFLLLEGKADLVGELASAVRAALAATPEAISPFLASYLDARALRVLIQALPPAAEELPTALAELLDAAPGDTLGRLVDLLTEEGDGPRAPLLRRLVARGCRHAPETLAARLRSAKGEVAVVLLRLLGEVDPAAALHAAGEASTAGEAPLQLEALKRLEAAAFSPEVGRALRHLVESPFEEVRVAALPVMAVRGGPRVFPALLAHVEKHAAHLSPAEATAAGRALVRSSARSALDAFQVWLHPKGGGLLGRLVKLHAPLPLQRVTLAGVVAVLGEEAEEMLAFLGEKGDAEVAGAATAALAARRRAGGGRG